MRLQADFTLNNEIDFLGDYQGETDSDKLFKFLADYYPINLLPQQRG